MHDVLGHTLSVIILKIDLAARLMADNPDGATQELADVDRIARETLDEVRETLRGYRTRSLKYELELARHTLSIAGIAATVHFDEFKLDAAQEHALSFALREGVTNVVRHAHAKRCNISLTESPGVCRLAIEDDGGSAAAHDCSKGRALGTRSGSGLEAMRERISARGGSVTLHVERGTRLVVELPSADRACARNPASRSA
jgi:two-component system sensor histidine kinase DesK